MDNDICANYESDQSIENLNIGYAKGSGPLFIIIPSFSIILNLFVLITYWKKQSQTKKNQYYIYLPLEFQWRK